MRLPFEDTHCRSLRKADGPPPCGWASSNQSIAWDEQMLSQVSEESLCRRTLSLDTGFSRKKHQSILSLELAAYPAHLETLQPPASHGPVLYTRVYRVCVPDTKWLCFSGEASLIPRLQMHAALAVLERATERLPTHASLHICSVQVTVFSEIHPVSAHPGGGCTLNFSFRAFLSERKFLFSGTHFLTIYLSFCL